MREILFRGKDIAGNWHYGDLINLTKEIKQICNHNQLEHAHSVNPETVGQYTGLTDKNGKKIFEGDIVEMSFEGTGNTYGEDGRMYDYDFYGHKIGVVSFGSNGTFLNVKYGELHIDGEIVEGWTPSRRSRIAGYRSEIIGNIHDNPELLKGGSGDDKVY